MKNWIDKLEQTVKEYRTNMLGLLKENENLKEKIFDMNGLLELSKTQTTVVATQKDISDCRVDTLRKKNMRDNRVHQEMKDTNDQYYKLLQNNYVDLRNDFDNLMNKYCNLEMENAKLLNSKQLSLSENTRVRFFKNIFEKFFLIFFSLLKNYPDS